MRSLGADGVALEPHHFSDLVEELELRVGDDGLKAGRGARRARHFPIVLRIKKLTIPQAIVSSEAIIKRFTSDKDQQLRELAVWLTDYCDRKRQLCEHREPN